jgi:ATP-dependent dihydroxyacetone kinase
MRKLINNPRNVVSEMLEGLVDLQPSMALLDGESVIVRSDLPAPQVRPVAVISGGGSGHEPAHAGYVGYGMLSAAIAGDVFTSPSVDAIVAAIRAVSGPAGALLIVKNYTGDRLNFGLAAELANADGIPTRVVVVADDVALHDTVGPSRRRGIAGTVLVHKMAGAAASAGLALDAVTAEAAGAAEEVGTMGVALGPATVPAAGRPSFTLADTEMELGLGIHGEPGVRRVPVEPADAVVESIVTTIVSVMKPGSKRVALLVNGLGGTPSMELAIVARRALAVLRDRGFRVERAWAGNFMTALEMPGCSLSLMIVDDTRLARLDAVATAPSWPGGGRVVEHRAVVPSISANATTRSAPSAGQGGDGTVVRRAAFAAVAALEREEAALTELDGRAGDGDLGISMARGAAAVRAMPAEDWRHAAGALAAMANVLRRSIAGSSGPFYAVALLRAARELTDSPTTPQTWARAFSSAVAGIAELGGARRGDRTMLDALAPASEAFTATLLEGVSASEAWQRAIRAAEAGTAATAGMQARLGRAAYLGERVIGSPDAGATAVLAWMRAIATVLP